MLQLLKVYSELDSTKFTHSGYNVVVIPVGIYLKDIRTELTPEVSLSRIKDIITRMINTWQVVFVVAAGTYGGTRIVKTYPAIWATQLPIVVVGAVDVFTGEDTYNGPALTVRGPAQGYCLGQNSAGTSVASAYVGGLVAYFLSLPDLGAYLRQGSVPRAMIEHLRRLSYSRSPSDTGALAVWNGLDSSKAMIKYSYWVGDPMQDVEVPRTADPP